MFVGCLYFFNIDYDPNVIQENDPDKKETKSSDLQGYWDMMYIQIEDVHNLFEDIDKLRANNWLADETDGGIYKKVRCFFFIRNLTQDKLLVIFHPAALRFFIQFWTYI